MAEADSSTSFDRNFFDSRKLGRGTYYEYTFGSRYPRMHDLASALTNSVKPKKILDLGCAKGFLVLAFRNLGAECYGVDISEYAISDAPKEIRDFLFKNDLVRDDLPFTDETFDLVTSLGILEYLPSHNNVIAEANRVLKPGGLFLLYADFHQGPYRVNVHNVEFWIDTITHAGLNYMPEFKYLGSRLLGMHLDYQFLESVRKGKILKHLPTHLAKRIFRGLNRHSAVYLFFRKSGARSHTT